MQIIQVTEVTKVSSHISQENIQLRPHISQLYPITSSSHQPSHVHPMLIPCSSRHVPMGTMSFPHFLVSLP